MNILYLAHRIPYPPDKGDKLRAFRQIEHLSRRHRVWCACFVDRQMDMQFVEPLRAYCEDLVAIRLKRASAVTRGLAGLLTGQTVTESIYRDPAMTRAVRSWADSVRFDVAVAFSSAMARYAFEVPAARRVLDLCDLDSRKWLDYAASSTGLPGALYRVEGRRLGAQERAWIRTFDAGILITEAEAAPIREFAPVGRLHIVANGVDIADYGLRTADWTPGRNSIPNSQSAICNRQSPIDNPQSTIPNPQSAIRNPTVGFVGTMSYRPNVDAVRWFVAECWPDIRAAFPNAVFRIVGRSPRRAVRRLAKVPGVHVVGEVEDMVSEVRKFDISVAPMSIARGLQNKVLEAMAAAKPVVLTGRAATGLTGKHEREYLVAETAREFVTAVIRLLRNPGERDRLGTNARRFVAANHCWEGELQKFELIVAGVLGRTARLRESVEPASAVATVDRDLVGAV